MTDTVGFVQKLPTRLVASFRATLEEIADARLAVHVVDASLSAPMATSQIAAVSAILDDIAPELPQVAVLNKQDVVSEAAACRARRAVPADGADAAAAVADDEDVEAACARAGIALPRDVIKTSTTTNEGIDELVATIDRLLVEMNREIRAELPYSEGALLNDIHELGAMLHEEFTPSGTLVHARVPPSLYGRLQPYEVSSTAR